MNSKQLSEHLENILHGSGYDGSWQVMETSKGNLKAAIDYHCMNESGFYDGWITLLYTVEKDLSDFKLTFPGVDSTARRNYCDEHSRGYYEEQFQYALEQIRIEEAIELLEAKKGLLSDKVKDRILEALC